MSTPSRWGQRLLTRTLPKGPVGDAIKGDLLQEFAERIRRQPAMFARLWFNLQVVSVCMWSLLDRWRGHRWGHPVSGRRGGILAAAWAEVIPTTRALVRRPQGSLLIVATLAAGFAATTTVLTVADSVLVRPLPYPNPDSLVMVGMVSPGREWRDDAPHLQQLDGVAVATLVEWRKRLQSVTSLEAFEPLSTLLPDTGAGPELVRTLSVTEGGLDLLGLTVAAGRGFVPEDFTHGAPRVLLISDAAWRTRYGGQLSAIGRVQAGATIVGVLSGSVPQPEVLGSTRFEFWSPLALDNPRYQNRARRTAYVFGRLRAGATLAAARAELAGVQRAISAEHAEYRFPDGTLHGAGVNGLQQQTVGSAARPIGVYLGATLLLLLIATVNAANLFLLRSADRRGDAQLRMALGAGRGRIVARTVIEGLVLSSVAAVAGFGAAHLAVAMLVDLGITSIPRLSEVAVSGRAALAAATMAALTGVFATVIPGVQLARSAGAIGGERAFATVAPGGRRRRQILVAAQVAIAVVLAVGANLLLRTYTNVADADLGFDDHQLTAMTLPLKGPNMSLSESEAWRLGVEAVRAIPGVSAAAAASDPPFADPSWAPWVSLPGDPVTERRPGVVAFVATPGFFDAVGSALVAGRDFAPSDSAVSERVAIVNQQFVEENFAAGDPIGALILLRNDGAGTPDHTPLRIVGVAPDIVQQRLEDRVRPAMYVPYTQEPWPYGMTVLVRSSRTGEAFERELRLAARRVNPSLPVTALYSVSQRREGSLAEPRLRLLLFGSFAAVSLLLSVVGVFGSLSHEWARRRRELGVRMALGADQSALSRLVLKQAGWIVASGLVPGVAVSLMLSRGLQGFLFRVEPTDLTVMAGAVSSVALAALLAGWLPARSVARTDVASSLRRP